MIQMIITLIIVAAAVIFALRGIFRFFRKSDEIACSPDRCSSCPAKGGSCMVPSNGGNPHEKNVSFPKLK